MKQTIYNQLTDRKHAGRKSFAVLIDPDKVDTEKIDQLVALATQQNISVLAEAGLGLQVLIEGLALLPTAPTEGIASRLPALRRLAARF